MSTSITSSITGGQEKQYRRFVEDATAKGCDLALQQVPLDKDGLQKLISRGDEFNAAIARAIVNATRDLSVSNEYADEEVKSTYGYLSGYKPKGITTQTNRLRELISGVGFADEKLADQPLPAGAEGYFAIPRWETIAPTYGEAVEKVLALISKTRDGKFYNYREGKLGAQYLREHDRSVAMWKRIGEAQKGYDILVVPAQFGLRHRGRSVRRARAVFNTSEFGLGAFAVGIMLLTHPERLKDYDDLWIDCAGDEYSPGAVGQFDRAPFFSFYDGRVKFRTLWVAYALGGCGSASGFAPQCA